jgi:hypothetical protein
MYQTKYYQTFPTFSGSVGPEKNIQIVKNAHKNNDPFLKCGIRTLDLVTR